MRRFILLFSFLPSLLAAQTLIYRSVQENKTTAVATNALGTLTISGSTATFSAALPDTVGVGDIIEYDVTDNGTPDNIAVIHGRTSSTVFTVKDSLGGTSGLNAVTGDNAWNIFRAYTLLSNWQSRTENTGLTNAIENFDPGASRNIDTANEQWHVAFYGQNQSGGTTIDPTVWTTGTGASTDYIHIYAPSLASEVGVTQKHSGFATATKVRIIYNALLIGININVGKTIVEDLQFIAAGVSVTRGIGYASTIANSSHTVRNCIIKGNATANSANGITAGGTGTPTTYYFSNNIIYDWTGSNDASDGGIQINEANATAYIFNNTCYGNRNGLIENAGACVFKNNIGDGSTVNDFISNADAGTEYNASEDNTAPGTNSRTSQTFTYIDEAGDNFLLSPNDLGARNYGKSLLDDANLAILKDIIGLTRPQGPNFDIGASEVAGALSTTKRKYIQ